MNKAFVREADDERASNPLPDRPIPAEPNLVTPEGLAHIQEMADLAQEQHTAARDAGENAIGSAALKNVVGQISNLPRNGRLETCPTT